MKDRKPAPAVDTPAWLDRVWYEKRVSQEDAEAFCRTLAQHHYENFTVASFLLPAELRQHFYNVYAYCRIADDLADELATRALSLERLQEWETHLERCYKGDATHPVFVALRPTIDLFRIPQEPFAALLAAFRQDQNRTRYDRWEDLLGYCEKSANPVGRLVLYLCGYRDETRQRLSDATCTALQLTNFWQDVARDYAKGRIYIPQDILSEHGYSEQMLSQKLVNEAWVSLMKDLLTRTRPLFDLGLELCALVRGRVRLDIELFSRGGLQILRAIENSGYDTLRRRPKLTRWTEGRLILEALLHSLLPRGSNGLRRGRKAA